ncbi:interleukin-32-like [Rhinolophus sinicus]|uniref:interleukin-32-like n=1 Tax=Rhinolophus sinicus TaxID=89399 RepID=UPI003D7A487A
MCYSKIPLEKIEKLRTNMHKNVDTVCDHLVNNREDQVQSALAEMENQVSEDLIDVVDAYLQSNNQESTPLLLKDQEELHSEIRCRHQKLSGPELETEDPVAQQPRETFWQKVCSWFQGMLHRLKETCQKVWTWVKEKVAAFCSKMVDLWNIIESLFSSVAHWVSTLQAS